MKHIRLSIHIILLFFIMCNQMTIASIQDEIDTEKRLNDDYKKLIAKKTLLDTQLSTVDEEIALSLAHYSKLLPEHLKLREAYRTRMRLESIGMSLDTLTLKGGKTYENVKIQAVQDVGLSISHKDGIARITYTDLPDDLRNRFIFDADEAASQLQQEKADHANFESLEKDRSSRPAIKSEFQASKAEVEAMDSIKPIVETGYLTAIPVRYYKGWKDVEFSANANCNATVHVDGSQRFSVQAKRPSSQVIRVPNNYSAKLVSAKGKMLDSEGTLRKTGHSLDTQHNPLKR